MPDKFSYDERHDNFQSQKWLDDLLKGGPNPDVSGTSKPYVDKVAALDQQRQIALLRACVENSIISAGTDIRLTNAGINKSDKIIFEHGSLIGTGPSGNVLIRLGALNGVNAKAPKNAVLIKESGGVIDFFGRRARSNERSYFIARGGNITVSSSGKKRNLIFNGTTIKASP